VEQSRLADKTMWEPPKKIWNGMFISIFFTNMALSMGQQMSNTLLSVYANSFGAPADQIGQLMSMFAVTALIFRFISGPAMNAYNRKKLVAMAMGFMATAYLGFSFAQSIAEFVGVKPITVLMAFRLFQGVGNAFGSACCLTMVSDTLPKDKFTTGMGYYACAQVVAQAIGPTVGVFLRDCFGYSNTYVIIFFVMCFAIFTYVANPQNGFSSHSRGNTVDVTLVTLEGEAVEMPTEFDDFSLLADRDYSDVPEEAAQNAILLETIMTECGFKPYSGEWWHFSDVDTYPVEDSFVPG